MGLLRPLSSLSKLLYTNTSMISANATSSMETFKTDVQEGDKAPFKINKRSGKRKYVPRVSQKAKATFRPPQDRLKKKIQDH